MVIARLWSRIGGIAVSTALVGAGALVAGSGAVADAAPATSMRDVVPAPAVVAPVDADAYRITARTQLRVQAGSAPARDIADQLAGTLRRSTGYRLPVTETASPVPANGISLLLTGAGPDAGDEGYRLDVTRGGVTIRANGPAGLFHGVQTLRQLLPAAAESASRRPGPWPVPGGHVLDRPRFGYRGAMLDVARHFFTVAQVERYIDEIALYKINYLHLHLSDDQGWRIAIASWPRLAEYGGGTAVGGGPGGFYTREDYRRIVEYAASRYVTVVPEIDMPGHTNAALASYAELNCDGVAPPRYTGIDVGFSSLCVGKDVTYDFVRDVVGELAAMTPGPYLHIGGDEAKSTSPQDYATFIGRVLPIVAEHGKTVVGWHDVTRTSPPTSVVPQYWGTTGQDPDVAAAAARGNRLVLSPANRAYLDQKYDPSTPLGLSWAGYVEVRDAYGWDPGSYLAGVPASSVLGVEAPLWSETLTTTPDIEYMAFPRLPAIAELGWSPAGSHDWEAFKRRLGAQGPRWTAMGINFYRSPQVPWRS
jgi:hexosaminidase